MTFFERIARARASVAVAAARSWRALSSVTRSLDSENFAAAGANRLPESRLANRRFWFDVAGSLTVFGDATDDEEWDTIDVARKGVLVGAGQHFAFFDPTEALADGSTPRLEGASVEYGDGEYQVVSMTIEVLRFPGPVVLGTFVQAAGSAQTTRTTSFAEAVPAGTTRYTMRVSAVVHFADTPATIASPCICVGGVLHFSARAVS